MDIKSWLRTVLQHVIASIFLYLIYMSLAKKNLNSTKTLIEPFEMWMPFYRRTCL